MKPYVKSPPDPPSRSTMVWLAVALALVVAAALLRVTL